MGETLRTEAGVFVCLVLASKLFAGGNLAEIWEIQGSGRSSPFADERCTTRDNVVTAVGPRGFFLQTPTERSDRDENTSDGIYVYTGTRPPLAPGDRVDVSGLVIEFYGMTEFSANPTLTVHARETPLPPPVLWDASRPSPLAPGVEPELERYEGMLVKFTNGVVTAPTNRYGEITAVARAGRTYREPGIRAPGVQGLPVWDGNPETFEIAPHGLGTPRLQLAGGTEIKLCTGPLTFRFEAYQIWPTSLQARDHAVARPVRDRKHGEFTVATQNLFWLFDDVNDPLTNDPRINAAEYDLRLRKHSLAIREILKAPDILAAQEVENVDVLRALADQIKRDDSRFDYTPHLIEGDDGNGIDVGFLVSTRIVVDRITQIGTDATFESESGSLLRTFPRPPLMLTSGFATDRETFAFSVINVHLRSLRGIDSDHSVRVHRQAQAEWLAKAIHALQSEDPNVRFVVTGDFNAFEFTDGYVDVLGAITGHPDPAGALLPVETTVDPPLKNEILGLPAMERYSFIFDGNAQTLDHMLTSTNLQPWVRDIAFGRNNADAPVASAADASTALRASDHDGLVLYLAPNADDPAPTLGDVNGDQRTNEIDVMVLFRYLYAGGSAPASLAAADVNQDGRVNLADAIGLLTSLYGSN